MKPHLAHLLALLFLATMACGQSTEELILQGDALDAKNKNAAALEVFLLADTQDPGNAEILRRVAKQYSQLIFDAKSTDEKEALADKSVDFALRAKKAAPKNAKVRLTVAIAYGRAARLKSPKASIAMSQIIRDEAEAATRLDPNYGLAWHVLGRWHYEMANLNPFLKALAEAVYGDLPDASNSTAAEYLKKSVQLCPPSVVNHVEYGRALLAMDQKEEARRQLEKGLSLPSTAKDDESTKQRAREALKSLK